ncbi:MAG: 3-deoxy-D-manno-octulosonic acid transferase [Planctomycetaceae bacterium]|nr:3-deoxy-D-manno-octulosonic acid transferase [Planctomycetaceae bacterium]
MSSPLLASHFIYPKRFNMIHICFNFCYLLLLLIFSPFLLYTALVKGKYREGFKEKMLGNSPIKAKTDLHSSRRIWIHAVSVGEVNLAAAILKEWEKRHPNLEFVISTTSKTGMELAQKKFTGKTIFYAPLDFSWAVRRALKRIQPDVLVLVELELWPNLLLSAQKMNIPVWVMNGRLGEKSFQNYSRIRPLMRRITHTLTFVTAQDESSAERFRALGAVEERVMNVGSIKYDGAQCDRENPKTKELAALWSIKPEDKIFLAGSTQDPEEEMALEVFQKLKPDHPELRLILVPRHPERFSEVAKMLEKKGQDFLRRSQINENTSEKEKRKPILLVDTIGELGGWWGTSSIGFVGGSMGKRGGQNMLEPAAFGTAVSFGPNTWNFRDIVSALLSHKAAVVVRNGNELRDFVQKCLEEPDFADTLGKNARDLVAKQQGALQRTLDLFEEKLPRMLLPK